MKIWVGTENPAKIQAVKNVFPLEWVKSAQVSSKVSLQPFSDEETLEGAINRARECAGFEKGSIGIGLEGGVMETNVGLLLCNWGALVDAEENLFIASGARIPLPDEIAEALEKGTELGEVMDAYAAKTDVRKKEGAIGIFTNNEITRESMFTHVMQLLKGQMDVRQMST